jgi:hypothetical protein
MREAAARVAASTRSWISRIWRFLNIRTVDEALTIVVDYFDEKQLLPKTRLVLEELFA